MTVFIQNDATGAGAGNVDPNDAAVSLAVIANGDTSLGLAAQVGNRQQVTYAQSLPGAPPTRLANLVNTAFTPDYGAGAQAVNIIIIPVLANFTLSNGTSILTIGGTALPPTGSGLPGAGLNTTTDCLVIYDTSQNNGNGYCVARAGTGGTLDLQLPNPVILYHELSHAFRTVNNTSLALTAVCNPSSPEENAAITDENDLRTQIANAGGVTPVLRDPGIHCGNTCAGGGGGGCCIVATVASGSPVSQEVNALRAVRDGLIRRTEVGFAFFETLHYDYYGFSPQVCTLMARRPALRPLILEGFVRPFVSILHLIAEYAIGGGSATSLGSQFVAGHEDEAATAERLAMLDRAQHVLDGDERGLDAMQRELTELLRPALDSEHLRWAILEPVRLVQAALRAHLDGVPVEEIDRLLNESISAWAARLPLDSIWAALSAAELREELEMLDSTILRTVEARSRFRERLQETYGALPAIAALLGAPSGVGGDT
jgi:hypothetical protein